jgi:hypothetical protein
VGISIARLRSLAAQKGLVCERHPWRGRVRLICRNEATLCFPLNGHRWSGWQPRHAWRFLHELPDAE